MTIQTVRNKDTGAWWAVLKDQQFAIVLTSYRDSEVEAREAVLRRYDEVLLRRKYETEEKQ